MNIKIVALSALLLLTSNNSNAENWFKKTFKKDDSPIKSITENKINNTIELESNLAGFKKEEINILISEGILRINAEKKDRSKNIDEDEKKIVYKQKEALQRSLYLDLKKYNVNLDNPQNIKVVYNNGILWMSIPRSKNVLHDISLKIKEARA
jgi:HSP20 family protein